MTTLLAAAMLLAPVAGTPASCDGKPAQFHVHRAKALIAEAHDPDRYPDKTPVKPPEKFAWQEHRRCILARNLRGKVSRYRDRMEQRYDRRWKVRARAELYARLINPPGAGYLAGLRACESGGNYYVDSTYDGAYQFDASTWATTRGAYARSGWHEPAASSPLSASPEQQDIRAAILYRARGSSPWPVCG